MEIILETSDKLEKLTCQICGCTYEAYLNWSDKDLEKVGDSSRMCEECETEYWKDGDE